MKESIFIFHFRPLEDYPPIQNLLKFLEEDQSFNVFCLTTKGKMKTLEYGGNIQLIRAGSIHKGKLQLWWSYVIYNVIGFILLALKQPKKVIYFESLSAYAVYLYRKYFNKKLKVFIHYHEYATPNEFDSGSFVERYFHKKEKYLYEKSVWISHTNGVRLKKFLSDEALDYNPQIHREMPNYPSKNWVEENHPHQEGQVLKFIYVGHSLTPESTYIEEIIKYLGTQDEVEMVFNIFCMKGNDYLNSIDGRQFGKLKIKAHPPLSYFELSKMLSKHHIGLILYKASTDNYIYNAPNKLFEYLSCGLDVWYPQEMQGIYEYDHQENPKVIRLDYENLMQNQLNKLLEKSPQKRILEYTAEEVYSALTKKLKN